jgi:PKD repeat protein
MRTQSLAVPCTRLLALAAALALAACAHEGPTTSDGAAPGGINSVTAPSTVGAAPVASVAITGGIGTGGTAFTGGPVVFDGAGSTDADGTIVRYMWDFENDGVRDSTKSATTARWRYPTPGTRTVLLTVRDNDNNTSSTTTQVTVAQNHAPVAVIANGAALSTREGALVSFSSAGSGDEDAGQPVTYLWNTGDGYVTRAANPARRYADNGTYTVTLTLTDASGATAVDSLTVTVANTPPHARFITPAQVLENTGFVISALAVTDSGSADRATLKFSFDCGDGAGYAVFDTVPRRTCAASAQGVSRTLRLRVRDKDVGQSFYTRTVVTSNAAPVVNAAFSPPSLVVAAGAPLTVDGSFTDAGGNADGPFDYWINWGDHTATPHAPLASTGALPQRQHSYATPGSYTLYQMVRDKDGAIGRHVVTLTVTP